MSELSKVLGNHGSLHEVKIEDKVYKIKSIDQSVKVAYEKKLFAVAREAVTSFRNDLNSDEYVKMLTNLSDAYESGEFSFEGKRGFSHLKTTRGTLLLLSLLTGEDEMSVLKLTMQRGDEVRQILNNVIAEAFPRAKIIESKEPLPVNDPKE